MSKCECFSHMGANIVHCGASGNGLVVKLCNNMMLAISMIGAAETLNMGIRSVLAELI